MKLTRKEAIIRTIELWTELAEKGCTKEEAKYPKKYKTRPTAGCWLCELYIVGNCIDCPLYKGRAVSCWFSYAYGNWSITKTVKDRKKYAALFLKQLKAIKI